MTSNGGQEGGDRSKTQAKILNVHYTVIAQSIVVIFSMFVHVFLSNLANIGLTNSHILLQMGGPAGVTLTSMVGLPQIENCVRALTWQNLQSATPKALACMAAEVFNASGTKHLSSSCNLQRMFLLNF